MKTNGIQLFLAVLSVTIACLAFTYPNTKNYSGFEGCVTDEAGTPLIYVDVYDQEGNWLAETDVNGCFRFAALTDTRTVKFRYPGFESRTTELQADEEAELILPRIKHLPAVYQPDVGTIHPTESRGEHQIKGAVIDEGKEPLIGASILIKGTTRGTVTDIDGNFTLHSETECADLMISYTGFETTEQNNVCAGKMHRIRLKEGVALDEVVVTGLGSSAKRRDRAALRFSASDVAYEATPPASAAPPPPPPAPVAEMMMIAADAAPASPTPTMSKEEAFMKDAEGAVVAKGTGELPKAGQLTAGEVNDFSKWEMWSDISQEDLAMHRSTWKQYADHRYTLQLTTPSGSAVVNAVATLVDGQGNAIWQSRTDAQGRAELWAHYFREVSTAANGLSIEVTYEGKKVSVPNAKPFKEGINFQTIGVDCREDAVVDVAFVVDATGSMGDEIGYLQAELLDVINRVKEGLPGVDLQLGSVFYRDKNEEYLTRTQPFTADPGEAIKFLEQQQAMGGGDYPEAVETALESALDELAWRDHASTRLLFLVLDAPPHQAEENIKRMQVAVTKAAKQGIQIIPVSCSGVDKSTEYLLRSMALATNGTYTFVTDHSGIGNPHIEPSTDSYEVEFLNDVLARLTIERSKLSTCSAPVAAVELPETPEATERDWKYYPNPTSGPLSLKFEDNEGMLYLADAHGKLLLQRPTEGDFDMNLSAYPAGTYWLRHQSSEGEWTQGQVLLLRR